MNDHIETSSSIKTTESATSINIEDRLTTLLQKLATPGIVRDENQRPIGIVVQRPNRQAPDVKITTYYPWDRKAKDSAIYFYQHPDVGLEQTAIKLPSQEKKDPPHWLIWNKHTGIKGKGTKEGKEKVFEYWINCFQNNHWDTLYSLFSSESPTSKKEENRPSKIPAALMVPTLAAVTIACSSSQAPEWVSSPTPTPAPTETPTPTPALTEEQKTPLPNYSYDIKIVDNEGNTKQGHFLFFTEKEMQVNTNSLGRFFSQLEKNGGKLPKDFTIMFIEDYIKEGSSETLGATFYNNYIVISLKEISSSPFLEFYSEEALTNAVLLTEFCNLGLIKEGDSSSEVESDNFFCDCLGLMIASIFNGDTYNEYVKKISNFKYDDEELSARAFDKKSYEQFKEGISETVLNFK